MGIASAAIGTYEAAARAGGIIVLVYGPSDEVFKARGLLKQDRAALHGFSDYNV